MSRPDPCEREALAAEQLSIAYGRTTVVEALNLVIPSRAFTALLGPNGSGKSTVLRALAGLLAPRQGDVLLDGRSIAHLPVKGLARRIGMLAQGPGAPEGLTVTDLVRQGRYPHRPLFARWSARDDEACDEALSLTGMETFRDCPLEHLSGGQRQRAWIAMTLAQETGIILLDEPTTFLDLAHQIEVMELIASLVDDRGKTVVAVLHDLNQTARYADRMVLLKSGSIAAAGRPDEVMTIGTIADVFGVACEVVADPVTGSPMCIPLGRSRRMLRPGHSAPQS